MSAACRSTAPDGTPCEKPRGHRRTWHSADGREWEHGVSRPAVWKFEDGGHVTEADYQTWGQG